MIKIRIEFDIDPSIYRESDKEKLLKDSDEVRKLVHNMLEGYEDFPDEFHNKANIFVEYKQ